MSFLDIAVHLFLKLSGGERQSGVSSRRLGRRLGRRPSRRLGRRPSRRLGRLLEQPDCYVGWLLLV